MNKISRNQKGFGAVELVLVLVIVALVGVVGYMVYKNHHQPTKVVAVTKTVTTSPKASTKGTQTSNSTTTDTVVIKVPELGIEFTAPNSIKDLEYSYRTSTTDNGTPMKIADFSSSSLVAADSDCVASNGTALGSLIEVGGQYSSYSPGELGTLVKQFPTFSVSEAHGQTSCFAGTNGNNATAESLLTTQTPLFVNAVKSVTAVN